MHDTFVNILVLILRTTFYGQKYVNASHKDFLGVHFQLAKELKYFTFFKKKGIYVFV